MNYKFLYLAVLAGLVLADGNLSTTDVYSSTVTNTLSISNVSSNVPTPESTTTAEISTTTLSSEHTSTTTIVPTESTTTESTTSESTTSESTTSDSTTSDSTITSSTLTVNSSESTLAITSASMAGESTTLNTKPNSTATLNSTTMSMISATNPTTSISISNATVTTDSSANATQPITASSKSTEMPTLSTPDNGTKRFTSETTTIIATSTAANNPCDAAPDLCMNGGQCFVNGSLAMCNCSTGWTGTNCSTDVNECTTSYHKCNTNTSTCINTDGDYECQCHPGYRHGSHKKICQDIDECSQTLTQNNCSNNEFCTNEIGTYSCKCKDNFYRDSSGKCVKLQLEKVRYSITTMKFTDDLNDRTSHGYITLVREIEINATEMLRKKNNDGIYRLAVINLTNGSIIVTAVVQLNTTQNIILPAEFTKLPPADEDYCIWHNCDNETTVCRGQADIGDYTCECKDDTLERVQGVSNICQYKDECRPGTDMCTSGLECQLFNGTYKCFSPPINFCDISRLCENGGTCKQLADGGHACSCKDGFSGPKCETDIVDAKKVLDLQNILIGVGVGLGSLALFCSIALVIVCCSDRSRSGKAKMISSHHYGADDVTIDTWEPSLPRPKLKPGAFSHSSADGLEMDERRLTVERERGAGAENPAFIPEADYEGNGRNGRLVSNGKKGASDLVYF